MIPDDVPLADAVEQSQPVVDEPLDAVGATADADETPPLESDESDWREQRLTVDLDGEDDFRERV